MVRASWSLSLCLLSRLLLRAFLCIIILQFKQNCQKFWKRPLFWYRRCLHNGSCRRKGKSTVSSFGSVVLVARNQPLHRCSGLLPCDVGYCIPIAKLIAWFFEHPKANLRRDPLHSVVNVRNSFPWDKTVFSPCLFKVRSPLSTLFFQRCWVCCSEAGQSLEKWPSIYAFGWI